jgi:F-type H+-transporting ATPase subunit b
MELFHEAEFWVAVGFLLTIALLLWKGAHTLIGKMLDQRAAVIAAELNEARRLREDARGILAEYQNSATNAEAQAALIVTEARAEAERFAAESRAALKAQIERRTQAAQERIAQAEAAAMNEIRALAADAAAAAAERLIIARMDDKRAAALIESSIRDLGDKLN